MARVGAIFHSSRLLASLSEFSKILNMNSHSKNNNHVVSLVFLVQSILKLNNQQLSWYFEPNMCVARKSIIDGGYTAFFVAYFNRTL